MNDYTTSAGSSPLSSRFYVSDLLHLLRHYWAILLIVPVLIVVAIALYAFLGTKYYAASASVYMDPSFGHRIQTESNGKEPQIVEDEEALFSMEETICSPPMILRVLKSLKLDTDLEFLPQEIRERKMSGEDVPDSRLVDSVASRYSAELINATRIIKVHVRDDSPERASRIAEAFISEFVKFLQENRVESEKELKTALMAQSDKIRARAIEAEQNLNDFRSQQPDFLVEQDSNVFTQQMQDAATELSKANAELVRLRSLRDALEQIDAESNPMRILTLSKGQYAVDLESVVSQLTAADAKFEEVKEKYGVNHSEYRAASNQLTRLRDSLKDHASEIKVATTSKFDQLSQQKEILETEMKGLRDRFKTYKSAGAEFRGLQSAVEREWDAYDRINDRILNLGDGADMSANLATPMGASIVPHKSTKRKLISALAAGMVLSVGWVLVVAAILILKGLPFTSSRQINEVLGVPLISTAGKGRTMGPETLSSLHIFTHSNRVIYLTSTEVDAGGDSVCEMVSKTFLERGEPVTVVRICDAHPDARYSFESDRVKVVDVSSTQTGVKELKKNVKQYLKDNPLQNVIVDTTAVRDMETKLALGKVSSSAIVIVRKNGITREHAEKWFQRFRGKVENVLALYHAPEATRTEPRLALPLKSAPSPKLIQSEPAHS